MITKKVLALLFMVVLLTVSQAAFSQSSYADVKVDELTDAQIRQMIQRAESIGYNDAQLEQMAAAQGMPQTEIQKLRLRVQKIRSNQSSGDDTNGNNPQNSSGEGYGRQDASGRTYNANGYNTPGNNGQNNGLQNIGRDSLGNNMASLEQQRQREIQGVFEGLKPKVFGSDLFKNTNVTFEPNLRMATPKSYVIGPDDELLVDLTGDNEANYRLPVSPDGTIRLQYVGIVSVGGLSIEQATSKLRSSMAKTYPALRSGRSSIAVNLGNIRGIKIVLTGEVTKPGTYTLPSLATVFNALYAAGGPSQNGSFRKIQVIRNNRVVSTIDTYDFLVNGLQKGNVRLQDQDVIHIPVYETRIEVAGEVKRPALFEALKGDNIQDVLNFAGGFNTRAYTGRIKVLQNTEKERRITDIASVEFSSYTPKNGDKYIVEEILDRFENRVEIAGAVFRPGLYELEKGLTLRGLINKAEGLKEDAFLNRGYINRLNMDNTLSLIAFDVAKIISGTTADITLQREDKVTVSSLFDLRDEYKVMIQGEVRDSGTYNYAENMSLEDLIQIAGGFREGATPNRVEISRRIVNSDALSTSARTAEVFTVNIDKNLKLSDEAFVLKPFDVVAIRGSEGYQVQRQVTLEGEVLYPGTYTITRKDERISDLITRAGGLTPIGYAEGASLKRPGPKPLLNQKSTNTINDQDEEAKKFLNLKRLQQAGVKDTLSTDVEQRLIQSDLVGIQLLSILKNPHSKSDLIVEDGDVIRVPRQLQTVKVTGEVLNPNNIVFSTGKGFKQYVNGAGGFTNTALRRGAYIKYANGSVESARKFLFFNNYPKVKPGAEILVPKRALTERLTAQGWIGIGTAVASMAAIIVSLLR
jgi:protein involved in polysaccharide export with SLBB domain